MEYKERTYRESFSSDGRRSFCVRFLESDLFIEVDSDSYRPGMNGDVMSWLVELRRLVDAYIAIDPSFRTSLVPYDVNKCAPDIVRRMSKVSHRTGIGPMSAVAGAFAEYVALNLKERYACKDVLVENGGDIYADLTSDVDISVFAGQSPLSGKVGLHIPAGDCPLGICTSSGTVGPSLSFGCADAMMVVCKDVALADSYATALANKVQSVDDLQSVIDSVSENDDVLSAIVVKDDRMAMCGRYELRLFR